MILFKKEEMSQWRQNQLVSSVYDVIRLTQDYLIKITKYISSKVQTVIAL